MPDVTTDVTGRDLWELLDARVAATPDVEMACDERGRRITYAEFRERAEQVAAGIAALGIEAEDVVSWSLPTGFDAMVLSAALRRLDVVQNPIIPIYREREFGFCTRQTGAKLLIVPGVWRGFDYEAMARSIAERTPGLDVLVVDGDDGLPLGDPATLPPRAAPPATPADSPVRWLLYTSGTTSDPKGARHGDNALDHIAGAMADRLDTRDRDRSGIAFPYTHIGGITWLFATLQRGVVLVLDVSFDPKRTPRYFAAENVTHAGSGTPFHMAYLAMQRGQPGVPLFPHLKSCPGGGSPKPPEIHYEVKAELGGAGVVSSWGLTESPILTFSHFTDPDDKLATTEGTAMPGVTLVVVKADGTRAAPGEEGELRAKGPQIMRGYLDASLDVDAFDDDGFFRTGDLGTIDDDGYVVITGRLKDVIIRNAENISAKGVEDLLYEHPKVFDVAVIGLPDARTGERVCAVVALNDVDDPLTFAEMQEFLRMQAIPEQLEFIDVMPRNPSGKITKNVLREKYGGSG
jgi:acyl-CoA synthetase (AMP-forming)/AMP-acid ligase II